jgi:hypothetical protein
MPNSRDSNPEHFEKLKYPYVRRRLKLGWCHKRHLVAITCDTWTYNETEFTEQKLAAAHVYKTFVASY